MLNSTASILALISMLLIIFFDAFGDKIRFHWKNFIWNHDLDPDFWSPMSWKNKYIKNPDGTLVLDENGDYIRKTFSIFSFKFVIPVIFTNGWHLVKAAKIFVILLPISILLSYSIGYWWLNQIIAILVWGILFEWLFATILDDDDE